MILTLQDKDVLAEDADVLVNVNMVDDETYKQVLLTLTTKLIYSNLMFIIILFV